MQRQLKYLWNLMTHIVSIDDQKMQAAVTKKLQDSVILQFAPLLQSLLEVQHEI